MIRSSSQAPAAQVTLRAYLPAPARIELVPRPLAGRIARTALSILLFWGAVPLLLWVPPHYPWVVGAFIAGLFLAHREWTGRYHVRAFAGLCPRCQHPLSLGVDRTISLPHTLTCYHCHFEPTLEVRFGERTGARRAREETALLHRGGDCVGHWSLRWLADEPYLVCDRCRAHRPASPAARAAAAAEDDLGQLLRDLTREGGPLI